MEPGMTERNKPLWTEEAIALVETCWANGESASEIARRVNRTRCAVIGIINRRGFKRGGASANQTVAPLRTLTSALHRRSAVASYLATSAAPITLAGPAWSHLSNARSA
jgi:hypothetical protein